MKIFSKEHALQYQQWGDRCESWVMVDEEGLLVKLERMPAGTAEQKHYHKQSRQFFFILKGKAIFEINEEQVALEQDQGVHIHPLVRHKICNAGDSDLEFILSSQPSTKNDRVNC